VDEVRIRPETAAQSEPEAIQREPELAAHPGPQQYVLVAIVLALATGIEVTLYYMKSIPHPLLVALLLFFAAMKFVLVVLFFMHLRFDSPIFRRLFITGFALASTVYIVVLLTFRVFIRS
jgi:cytochrome c oxidase subunit 4